MFYSNSLLAPKGPLASVWISSNMERKLTKATVLQSNLPDKVEIIMTPGSAPLALRLTSQLLLGVVRIYNRKTRYLLDDCNEALMKIKLAFRSSGNNDIVTLLVQNREALLLPDRITPYDILELPPPPDAAWLRSQFDEISATPLARKGRVSSRDINLREDFNNSQFLQEAKSNDEDLSLAPLDDIELDLDFGMDGDFEMARDGQLSRMEKSLEVGRSAPSELGVEDDIFGDLSHLPPQKSRPHRQSLLRMHFEDDGIPIANDDGAAMMEDLNEFQYDLGDQSVMPNGPHIPTFDRRRISMSPLSDVDATLVRSVEDELVPQPADLYEQEEDTENTVVRKPAQRAKKQKLILPDKNTILNHSEAQELRLNRRELLKPLEFLPRDPYFMALINMQKNGGFVGNIMSGWRSENWAPELQGMLSMESAQEISDVKKRKRDSVSAEVDSEQGAPKTPRLDLETEAAGEIAQSDGISFPADKSPPQDEQFGELPDASPLPDLPGFDETTAPMVYPADSGPVSIATTHAVHVLRELFGSEAAVNQEARKTSSVVFQDLLPENQTSKADATRMFFECLVLATKDAIKVEQGADLGAPIRIRGKRGLWGAWAEKEAGGEMDHQEQDAEVVDRTVFTQLATVSVEA